MTATPDAPITARGVNGQLSFDGTAVKITRDGFLARATQGRSDKTLPVRAIGSVQMKRASSLVNGFIQFAVSGETSKRSVGFGKSQDAARDENAVVFTKKHLDDFQAIYDAVIAAQSAPAAGAPVAPDVTDQLAKLGALRDSGVLTEEEFQTKKAQLLEKL